MKKTAKSSLKQWGYAFLTAFVLALLCRGLVFQSFIVSNTRMERTLMAGDFVFVEKLSYGARLPMTLLAIPFTNIYSGFIELSYSRIPGTGSIKRNDLMVFNYPVFTDPPIDKRDMLVKRCIALPGDTLMIENKKVTIDGAEIDFPGTAQFKYRLVAANAKLPQEFANRYLINDGALVSDLGIYDFIMTKTTSEMIKRDTTIKYIRELKDFPGDNCEGIFPQGKYQEWNKDYFGPLYIPKKGQTIKLTFKNIDLYKKIISVDENHRVETRDLKIWIDGEVAGSYTFAQNYYFVMDDNRDISKDSRYWGFVPENHVVGRVCCVWFSVDKNRGKVRWNRIFSRVY
jgi:signal peptidase I